MPASKHLRILSVRLPETELRRFKSLAASRGLSIQKAIHQAIESWASPLLKSPADHLDLRGSLAYVDVEALIRREKELELAKEHLP